MGDLLPSGRFSSPRPGNPALLTENATAWPQEQPGELKALRDHGDGPACPDRERIPRVLVVEDQAGLLRALQINMRVRLYDVITARTGYEAMAMAASRAP
jgi:hypothetical protein